MAGESLQRLTRQLTVPVTDPERTAQHPAGDGGPKDDIGTIPAGRDYRGVNPSLCHPESAPSEAHLPNVSLPSSTATRQLCP